MPSDSASTSSRLTIPISPTFSADNTNSAPHSEATSDEQPDLGQFTQILWAWNNLQPAPRLPNTQSHPPSSQTYRNAQSSISSFTHPGLSEASGTESLGPEESAETVWAQHQLQSYFSLNSITPSTEVHELDENEYDINIANHTYPDEGYEEAPPFSPASDGSQTVEICEATSDFDNPDSSFHHNSDGSPAGRPIDSSVMGSSSSKEEIRWMAAGSGAGGHSPLKFRGELALRHSSHINQSFNRHSRQGSSEGVPVHITPRQADFPIHDQSSTYSQSTARTVGTRTLAPPSLQAEYEQHSGRREDVLVDDTSSVNSYPTQADSESAVQSLLNKARVARSLLNDNSTTQSADASDSSSSGTRDYSPVSSQPDCYHRRVLHPAVQATPPRAIRIRAFSPQMEPPSPLPTPQDSEVLLYSPQRQHLMVGEMDDDYSLTPTRAPARSYGHLLPQHVAETDQYLAEGVAHAYPHPLKGLHVLPTTITHSERQGDLPSKGAHDGPLPVRSADDVVREHFEDDLDHDQPSLGLLDEALGFIAAERAKYEALRASGAHLGDGGPTLPEWQHVVDSSNTKRKRRKKKGPAVDNLDDSPLQMSRTSSMKSTTRPLLLAADPDNALPESDHDAVDAMNTNLLRPTNDKRLMILTRPKPLVTTISAPSRIEDEPLRLIGKKGKRVGRKEREREKVKRDKERAALEAADPERTTRGNGEDDGKVEEERDKGEEEVDLADEDGEGEADMDFSSSGGSVFNISALRASAGSRAYIHEVGPGKGVYKSTPATPRAVTPTDPSFPEGDKGDGALEGREADMEEPLVIIPPVKVGRRKKSRKRPKTLEHSKSYPNLRQDVSLDSEDHETVTLALPFLDQTKRSRLIDLADRLESIFPEDHKDLKGVIQRLESVSKSKGGLTRKGSVGGGRGKAKHSRNGSEGAISTPNSSIDAEAQDPVELEVIGRTPPAGDAEPLIHVFIDHSNILIGLLNFLKRHPPPKPVVSEYLSSRLVKPSLSLDKVSTPMQIPVSNKRATGPLIEESPADGQFAYPIPLPSFATVKGKDTVSMSLPSDSALDAHMSKRRGKNAANGIISYASEEQDRDDDASGGSSSNVEKKAVRFPRHLWHAALVLVLERGRAISRRVVVTSSPLYQPMESIQNLGYEVRIYMRVPNLGDGMDQERKKARYSSSRSIYAVKGPTSKKTHMRHVSGSTSAESGSAGAIAQAHTSGAVLQSAAASSAAISKIKYREQGVDELLQLKLHQAIADVDTVPSNSTIVLATGDGNVGQFNEDGFLGPVRTALKRGWKVELYAWEDGLSRSWRREFGENSEWGKKGLFRIIPLEQFATSLVEAAGW